MQQLLVSSRLSIAEKIHSSLHAIMRFRIVIGFLLAMIIGMVVYTYHPFPADDPLVSIVRAVNQRVYESMFWAYLYVAFATPFCLVVLFLSQIYVRFWDGTARAVLNPLPPYPEVSLRDDLFLVLGETHNRFDFEPGADPSWCVLPELGLYTGTLIVGAVGGGKTSSAMMPYVDQLVGFQANDPDKKLSGLVLEVKGDFCHKVRDLLESHGRAKDYFEIGLGTEYRFNPLRSSLDATARAYRIASASTQLFGKSTDPYWMQQASNTVKYIIMLYELVDDYVTFADIRNAMADQGVLQSKLQEARIKLTYGQYFMIHADHMTEHAEAFAERGIDWEAEDGTYYLRAAASESLSACLQELGLPLWPNELKGPVQDERKAHVLRQVELWAEKEWMTYHDKLKNNITSTISPLISLFVDDYAMVHTFCPPKELYEDAPGEVNEDHHLGIPVPSFDQVLDAGVVCALNFPVYVNPILARFIGTLLKADFQSSLINRIPKHSSTGVPSRPCFFVVDEYQNFATVGGTDQGTGDENFFALSRQARCIPIVATQSVSSLESAVGGRDAFRTLLQTLRTVISFATNDEPTAQLMEKIVGKTEKVRIQHQLSESAQDAQVSLLTGKAVSDKSSLSQSMSVSTQRDFIFEESALRVLPNAVAIAQIYDGRRTHTQVLYTCPYYLPNTLTWHEKHRRGMV